MHAPWLGQKPDRGALLFSEGFSQEHLETVFLFSSTPDME